MIFLNGVIIFEVVQEAHKWALLLFLKPKTKILTFFKINLTSLPCNVIFLNYIF